MCQADFNKLIRKQQKSGECLMHQESPYTRYHRNLLGAAQNASDSGQLCLQTRNSNFQNNNNPQEGANIYLQSLQEAEPAANSGKKQRKIKVFGISEHRIKRDEVIPSMFDVLPEIEKNDQKEQMLIDSQLQIATTSLISQTSHQAKENGDVYDQNQLQQLLYCSGSSASLPPAQPITLQKKAEYIKTQQIDHLLQAESPVQQTVKQASSVRPSRINFSLKNTDSAYLADEKAKQSQNSRVTAKNSYILKDLKECQNSKDSMQNIYKQTFIIPRDNSKVLQINELSIAEPHSNLQFNTISPIAKRYDQILQASVDYDQPKQLHMLYKSPRNEIKIHDRPAIPLPKKIQKVDKFTQQLNIKNYFESYGNYEQQIEKMINKLQKVSDLKDKQMEIKRELKTLTNKKHQSVDNIDPYPKVKSQKSYKPLTPKQKPDYQQIFTQSASNFIPQREETLPRNLLVKELNQKVVKMERFINRFKQISQILSIEDNNFDHKEFNQHERSQKYIRSPRNHEGLMFQSQKFAAQSLELHNYSCKKTNSQPQIHSKMPEHMKGTLNQSQEIESQSRTYKERAVEQTYRNGQKSSIAAYSNTVRTQKKPLNSLVERCQSNYHIDLHKDKQCECDHTHLAQEIAKLTKKVQDLQKEKVRQALSKDRPSYNKHSKLYVADDEGSLHGEQSQCFQMIPKQIQESLQSIKAKIDKKNPHICSNIQPVSIIRTASNIKRQASNLKTEEIKLSPAITKRKNSKELPPKPKNISKSPHIKKQVKRQNQFREDIDVTSLKLNFPNIIYCLTYNSSQNSIIKFGQIAYSKLFSYACARQNFKGAHLDQKSGFKIKKYQDCIHYYLLNSFNYHLICYFKGKLYFGELADKGGDCKNGFGFYSTPKYIYEGEFLNDKKHGRGTINYANGDMYQGEWKNGKRQGLGVMVNQAGDTFKGNFQQGKKNGRGEERLKNGDFYRGQFKDGKLSGEGKYWWNDGSIYQGGFKNGLLHGHGVWRSKDNDCYEGEYRQNKKYGKGIYKWSNGMIFTGVFEADKQVPLKKQLSHSPDRKFKKSGQRPIRPRQNSAKKA